MRRSKYSKEERQLAVREFQEAPIKVVIARKYSVTTATLKNWEKELTPQLPAENPVIN